MMSTSDHSKKDEETMEKLQNSPYAEATRTKNNGGNHLKEQNCYIFSLAMRHLLIQESFEYKRFSTRRIKITTTHLLMDFAMRHFSDRNWHALARHTIKYVIKRLTEPCNLYEMENKCKNHTTRVSLLKPIVVQNKS